MKRNRDSLSPASCEGDTDDERKRATIEIDDRDADSADVRPRSSSPVRRAASAAPLTAASSAAKNATSDLIESACYPVFEAKNASEQNRQLIFRLGECEPFVAFKTEQIVARGWVAHAEPGSPHSEANFYFAAHSKAFRVVLAYNSLRYRFSLPAHALSCILIAIDKTSHTVVLSLERKTSSSSSSSTRLTFETSEPGTFASWEATPYDWSENGSISASPNLTVVISCASTTDVKELVDTLESAITTTTCEIGLAMYDPGASKGAMTTEQVKDALAHDRPFITHDRAAVASSRPSDSSSSTATPTPTSTSTRAVMIVYEVAKSALVFSSLACFKQGRAAPAPPTSAGNNDGWSSGKSQPGSLASPIVLRSSSGSSSSSAASASASSTREYVYRHPSWNRDESASSVAYDDDHHYHYYEARYPYFSPPDRYIAPGFEHLYPKPRHQRPDHEHDNDQHRTGQVGGRGGQQARREPLASRQNW